MIKSVNIFFVVIFLSFPLNGQNYIAERNITGGASRFGEMNLVEFTVSDEEGNSLYKIKKQVDYDVPFPGISLFDDGSSVVVSVFDASLEFYNVSGELERRIILTEGIKPDYERSIFVSASDNFLMTAMIDGDNLNPLLTKLDKRGGKIFSWNSGEDGISLVEYSYDLNIVVVSGHNWSDEQLVKSTIIYDSQGNKRYTFPFMVKKGFFSGDYFICFDTEGVKTINLKNFSVSEEKITTNGGLVIDAAIYSGGIYALVSARPVFEGQWFYPEPELIKFEMSGKELERRTLDPFYGNEVKILILKDKLMLSTDKSTGFIELE